MRRNRDFTRAPRQHGAALIVFALIGAIAVFSLMLGRLTSLNNASGKRATSLALAQAKEALIGWSASHSTKPGALPCPENTTFIGVPGSEGSAQTGCSNVTVSAGRLAWRTLKIRQVTDDTGEPLWYALSPGFRSPSTINSGSLGQLTIDGSPNGVVAVIFSPGAPLSGQSRPVPTSADPPDISQYLEGYDLSGHGAFSSTGASGAFNDRLLTITRDELFRAVNRRILNELRGDEGSGLIKYYADNGTFPPAGSDLSILFASLLSTAAASFMADNGWYSLVNYGVSADMQQATLTINLPASVTCTITPSQTTCR